MKLFNFATIAAAAGIAHVLAVPLLVVTSSNGASVRPLPGPAGPDNTEFVVKMRKKGPCRAGRFSQKAVDLSNLFREALGLPLIKSGGGPGHDEGKVRILPFIGTPNIIAPVHGKDTDGTIKVISIAPPPNRLPPHEHHAHGRHRHGHHHHHHFGRGSFINRIHYSITNLGRWEGRAVAFVLGCGIGVLLRMLFVLGVVMYRAVKGRRGEEHHEYSQITIIEEIVEDPKTSPPSYVDEKYPVIVETVNAPTVPKEFK